MLLFAGRYLGKSSSRRTDKDKILKLCDSHLFFFLVNEQEDELMYLMVSKQEKERFSVNI